MDISETAVPWNTNTPYPLNRSSVLRNAPEASGVYGLRTPGQWVYIGRCSNIREALLNYLSGQLPQVLQAEPNLFHFDVCPPRQRVERQRELIQHFQPVCNRKHLDRVA